MNAVRIIEALTPTIAIIAIAVLETVALSRGIDGVLFSGVTMIIGALGGYQVKKVRDRLAKGGR
ncbi:MAG TPA: hypothetical protein G4O01_02890 [Dehalococcoidia bacterium]|jgi:hypothetical protein|nr:hypothetical protein [Dehalococcoidia bacterium]